MQSHFFTSGFFVLLDQRMFIVVLQPCGVIYLHLKLLQCLLVTAMRSTSFKHFSQHNRVRISQITFVRRLSLCCFSTVVHSSILAANICRRHALWRVQTCAACADSDMSDEQSISCDVGLENKGEEALLVWSKFTNL